MSLSSDAMVRLLTVVEEATRSTEESVRFFVEPAENGLQRATSKRHHIVFGRRGSGKSSLLRKAASDLTRERRPMAWVDLEAFKGHSYPDLLISVLIKTLEEFKKWLENEAIAPANKVSIWKKIWGGAPTRPPFKKAACKELVFKIDRYLGSLREQLHAQDDARIEQTSKTVEQLNLSTELDTSAGIKSGVVKIGSSVNLKDSHLFGGQSQTTEEFRRSKIDFLRRNIMNYQSIFTEMSALSNGDSYLFLDDLYHLRRAEQPPVLDYLHSIAKGNHLWLKVGTIRHRSSWYTHGTQPIGMKLGDDADEIDLDLTLEKYKLAKEFLRRVLQNLANSVELPGGLDFLTDTGLDRLVLASGGVARDFLAIFRRSVTAAREKGVDRVGAEHVNIAAGDYEPIKREELKRDTYEDEESELDTVFQEVRNFCLASAKSNCFLVDKELKSPKVDEIHELVDLKLLHLIRSRVTVNTRQGRIYEAYMLDLSQYAGARKRRDISLVQFWQSKSEDDLRKASFIYLERPK